MENLTLYIVNDRECVDYIQWLAKCIDKRRAKAKPVTTEHLAECSTMRKIVARGAKLVRENDRINPTNDDKRAARYAIADEIINGYWS